MNDLIAFQNKTIRDYILNNSLQLLEVKQLAELENQFKNQCKIALCAYRHWQKQYQAETDAIQLLYGQLDGVRLRRDAETIAKAYWIIRRDFRRVLNRYINDNKSYSIIQSNKKTG